MAKGQLTRVGAEIDAYHIALSDLLRSHQVSDGLDKQPLDGAFQVPGAISRVCTFVEQILLACVRYPQLRCTAWYRMMEPLLNAVLKSVNWDKKAVYQADLDRQLRGENVMAQQPPGYYPPFNMPGVRELNIAWDYVQLGQLDQAKAEIAKAPPSGRNQQLIDWLKQDLALAAA